jgi:hypothetical protein
VTKRTAAQLLMTALLLGAAAVPAALAAKGGHGGGASRTTALSPTSETIYNSPNPAAPKWCLNEDDIHSRTWAGSVQGSFSVTEQLCGLASDYSGGIYWDAGGLGIQADLYVTGTLNALTITSPGGESHAGVLVGSSGNTSHYQVCYMPTYSISTDTGGMPLPGGTWQITLSGNANVTFSETSRMAYVFNQQSGCPASEQNLVP